MTNHPFVTNFADLQSKLENPVLTKEDVEALIESVAFFTASDALAFQTLTEEYPVGPEYEARNEIAARIPTQSSASTRADILAAFGTFDQSYSHLTFCVIRLFNGQRVVGVNYGAINPNGFNAMMARDMAYKQAMEKVWEFAGFALRLELNNLRCLISNESEADALTEDELVIPEGQKHGCGHDCGSCGSHG
jgi:hypothetical protein